MGLDPNLMLLISGPLFIPCLGPPTVLRATRRPAASTCDAKATQILDLVTYDGQAIREALSKGR